MPRYGVLFLTAVFFLCLPLSAKAAGAFFHTYTSKQGMEFVLVPPGELAMGNAKKITFGTPFYISRHEVSQKQWMDVMGTNPSAVKGDNLPVTGVNHKQADAFFEKLRVMEGAFHRYDLATEDYLKYAAYRVPGLEQAGQAATGVRVVYYPASCPTPYDTELSLVDGYKPHRNGKPLPKDSYSAMTAGNYKWLISSSGPSDGQGNIRDGLHVFDSKGKQIGWADSGAPNSAEVRQPAGTSVLFVSTYNNTKVVSLPDFSLLASLNTMDEVAPVDDRGVLYTRQEKENMGRPEVTDHPNPKSVYYFDFALKKDIPVLTGNERCNYRLACTETDGFTFGVEKICAPAPKDWERVPDAAFSRQEFVTGLPLEVRNPKQTPVARAFAGGRYATDSSTAVWSDLSVDTHQSQLYFGISSCEIYMSLKPEGDLWQAAFVEAPGLGMCENFSEVFTRGDVLLHLRPVTDRADPFGRAVAFDVIFPQEVRDYLDKLDRDWFREHFNTDTHRYVREGVEDIVGLETVRQTFEPTSSKNSAPPQLSGTQATVQGANLLAGETLVDTIDVKAVL